MAQKAKKIVNEPNGAVWYALAGVRILLGFVFLWSFFDKMFGFGYATSASESWINGVSPTGEILKGVGGPFADAFTALAGQPWVDGLFMLGLLGVGIGLLFGIALRLSVLVGSVLLVLMWMASLPIKGNPVVDYHIIYIAIMLVIGYGIHHQRWSLANEWQKLRLAKFYWMK